MPMSGHLWARAGPAQRAAVGLAACGCVRRSSRMHLASVQPARRPGQMPGVRGGSVTSTADEGRIDVGRSRQGLE